MSLSVKEQQAAEFLAKGHTDQETATLLGVSRSWVARHKKSSEFISEIESAKKRIRQIITEYTKIGILNDLEDFRDRFRYASNLVYQVSVSYLEKLKTATELLKDEDINPSKISSSIKQGVESLQISLEIEQAFLGLDELTEQVNDLTKINSQRKPPPNGYRTTNSENHLN
ncbi:hypothetical protein HW132_28875 [Brasilonema sp. CT11]|nr:hypothetical protein [Brasilonema sp. CT11]